MCLTYEEIGTILDALDDKELTWDLVEELNAALENKDTIFEA